MRKRLLAGCPVRLCASRQARRQAGWTAGWLECGQACRPTGRHVYAHACLGYAHSRADMPTSILKRGFIPRFRSSFGQLGHGNDALKAEITA